MTPLKYASIRGYEEITKKLINRGADVNMGDSRGETPALFMACVGGHYNVVKILLDNKAKINIKNKI